MLSFKTVRVSLSSASTASHSEYVVAERLSASIVADIKARGDVAALSPARQSDWYALTNWISDFCSFNPLARR